MHLIETQNQKRKWSDILAKFFRSSLYLYHIRENYLDIINNISHNNHSKMLNDAAIDIHLFFNNLNDSEWSLYSI